MLYSNFKVCHTKYMSSKGGAKPITHHPTVIRNDSNRLQINYPV